MTEQEMLEQIDYIEGSIKIARRKISEARRNFDNAESELIELKIQRDKLTEQLTNYRETTTNVPQEIWDIDLERFRNTYPELCEWARERDANKGKDQ